MQKKAALITGSAKRIGQAIALSLAEEGYNLALHYNQSQKEALDLQEQVRRLGVEASVFPADLTHPASAMQLLIDVYDRYPDLCVLINNASVFEPSNLEDCSLDQIKRDFAVHLQAPLILIQQFGKKVKTGKIINIVDAAITKDKSAYFSYLLAKKSLQDLTEMAARQLAPDILVNAIAPGYILEPEIELSIGTADRLAKIPLGKKGDVQNITHSIRFLLNNDFITGQVLFVDGGEHLT